MNYESQVRLCAYVASDNRFDAAYEHLAPLLQSDDVELNHQGEMIRSVLQTAEAFTGDLNSQEAPEMFSARWDGPGQPLWCFVGGTGKVTPFAITERYFAQKGVGIIVSPRKVINAYKALTQEQLKSELADYVTSLQKLIERAQPSTVIVAGFSRFSLSATVVAGELKADHCVLLSPVTSIDDQDLTRRRINKGYKLVRRMQDILPEEWRDVGRAAKSWPHPATLDVIYASGRTKDETRLRITDDMENVRQHAIEHWRWHDTFPAVFGTDLFDSLTQDAVTAARAAGGSRAVQRTSSSPVRAA
ncbi:MAG: hypothetical protein AAGJ94_04310 [Pseudomonadota bacterium]